MSERTVTVWEVADTFRGLCLDSAEGVGSPKQIRLTRRFRVSSWRRIVRRGEFAETPEGAVERFVATQLKEIDSAETRIRVARQRIDEARALLELGDAS